MARKRRKRIYDGNSTEDATYENHADVMAILGEMQKADQDNKGRMREAHLFVEKRDGQWEQEWYDLNDGKPRYTFDQTSPIVDQIESFINKQEYAIQVDPAGGETTEDDADRMAGLIRSIENNSQAKALVYKPTARNMVISGADGWEVTHDYIDDDSFEQDIKIEKVNNWSDRIWFDPQSERQDHADAECAIKITAFSVRNFKKKWPDRSAGSSVELPASEVNSAFWHVRDLVLVGTLHYIKHVPRKLVEMSDGNVYEVNDDFLAVVDELEEQGITVVKTRDRPRRVQYTRKFDSQGWMEEPQETVFSYISLIPAYAHFKVVENKILYRGAVEKLLDSQRVYNYAMSRHVEEGAFAPRKKIWATQAMVKGYEDTIQTLNTNADPVQLYNIDPSAPDGRPHVTGGAEVNEGLLTLAGEMKNNMSHTSGMFAANMGDNPNVQSGIALETLTDRGDDGNSVYTNSIEIAICHTFRVIASAIPRVYTDQRQVRIVNEDGTNEVVTLNQVILDEDTMEEKVLRDMTKGQYNMTCKAGPSYQNRQEKTVAGMLDIAKVKPELIDFGPDILLSNMNAPGMDQLAERARRRLFMNGDIPYTQLSDEEREELQMMQQQEGQEQQDPMMIAAQAEMVKAQTEQQTAAQKFQSEQQDMMLKVQESEKKMQLQYMKMGLDSRREDRADVSLQIDQKNNELNQVLQAQKQQGEMMLTMARTLESIQKSMGANVSIVSPNAAQAYDGTAQQLNEAVGGDNKTVLAVQQERPMQ